MECILTGKKKVLRIILLAVFSAIFLACSVYFIMYYIDYRKNTDLDVTVSSQSSSSAAPKKELNIPVDFKKLQKINDEVYAWIKIPGTKIDFPILQSKSDENRSFYLNHNINRKSSMYGCIYTQNYNSTDFNDYNNVIYGHDMFDGTMFGTLKKYRNRSHFEKNNEIIIYMPDRILKYRIFAAVVFDDRHILLSFDFDDPEDRQLYLETIYEERKLSSNFDDEIEVTSEDKLITLSTCTSIPGERYLIQGVLVYDSDTDS